MAFGQPNADATGYDDDDDRRGGTSVEDRNEASAQRQLRDQELERLGAEEYSRRYHWKRPGQGLTLGDTLLAENNERIARDQEALADQAMQEASEAFEQEMMMGREGTAAALEAFLNSPGSVLDWESLAIVVARLNPQWEDEDVVNRLEMDPRVIEHARMGAIGNAVQDVSVDAELDQIFQEAAAEFAKENGEDPGFTTIEGDDITPTGPIGQVEGGAGPELPGGGVVDAWEDLLGPAADAIAGALGGAVDAAGGITGAVVDAITGAANEFFGGDDTDDITPDGPYGQAEGGAGPPTPEEQAMVDVMVNEMENEINGGGGLGLGAAGGGSASEVDQLVNEMINILENNPGIIDSPQVPPLGGGPGGGLPTPDPEPVPSIPPFALDTSQSPGSGPMFEGPDPSTPQETFNTDEISDMIQEVMLDFMDSPGNKFDYDVLLDELVRINHPRWTRDDAQLWVQYDSGALYHGQQGGGISTVLTPQDPGGGGTTGGGGNVGGEAGPGSGNVSTTGGSPLGGVDTGNEFLPDGLGNTTTAPEGAWWIPAGADISNLLPGELWNPTDVFARTLRNSDLLRGQGPAQHDYYNTLHQGNADLLELAFALGDFGQIGANPENTRFMMGDQFLQDVLAEQALASLQAIPTGGQFTDIMQRVGQTLNQGSADAVVVQNLMDQLTRNQVTGSANADFAPLLAYMAPRQQMIPTHMRGMFNNQVRGAFDDLTQDRASVGPGALTMGELIIGMLENGGLF